MANTTDITRGEVIRDALLQAAEEGDHDTIAKIQELLKQGPESLAKLIDELHAKHVAVPKS